MIGESVNGAMLDERMLDCFSDEKGADVRPIRQADCYICGKPWYISERKRKYHLDDRLFRKAELIKARQERKKGKGPKKPGPQPTPQPAAPGAVDIWDV
jgi:hypothetical protein